MNNNLVYVVVPVHNRRRQVLKFIEQMKQQTYSNFKLIVVDDGSSDGTFESIKRNYSSTTVIRGTGDWWWTRSVNKGCVYALNEGADKILLMNDDTYFPEDFLETLVNDYQNLDKLSILGALSITKEKKPKIFFSGVKKRYKYTSKSVKYHKQFDSYNNLNGIKKSLVLPGRGLLIPRKVFKINGLFDENTFPQYGADFDYVLRARKNNICSYITWNTYIKCEVSQTGNGSVYSSSSFHEFISSFFTRYSHRYIKKQINFFKRHNTKKFWVIPLIFNIVRSSCRFIINQIKGIEYRE